jgi:hypothetical protein
MTTTATDNRKNAVDLDDPSNMLTMLGKEERGGAGSEALETQGSRPRR